MNQTPPILIVEDIPEDAELIQAALARAGISNRVEVVGTAEAALSYLEGRDAFANRQSFPTPCLILLDLKLAKLTGFSVLKWRREHPEIDKIPILVLTASVNPADIDRAYELGAEDYLVKPKEFAELVELLRVKVTHKMWCE